MRFTDDGNGTLPADDTLSDIPATDFGRRRVAAILRTERPLPEQEDARLNQANFLLGLYRDPQHCDSSKIVNHEMGCRVLLFGVLARGKQGSWWFVSHLHEYHERAHPRPANVNVRSRFLTPLQ